MENREIRLMARGRGVQMWRIAKAIGVSEPTLFRWMREKLPDDKRQKILAVINELEEKEE